MGLCHARARSVSPSYPADAPRQSRRSRGTRASTTVTSVRTSSSKPSTATSRDQEKSPEVSQSRLSCSNEPEAVFLEYLVDNSGSMLSMIGSAIRKTTLLLQEQKHIALNSNTKIFISLTTFNSKAKTHLDNADARTLDISEEKIKQWLTPLKETRLIDTALERLIAQELAVRTYLSERKTRKNNEEIENSDPYIVRQFVIVTDGEDNMSKLGAEHLAVQIQRTRCKHNTIALFVATNQDAKENGRLYGFSTGHTLSFDEKQASRTFEIIENMIVNTSLGRIREFTEEERKAVLDASPVLRSKSRKIGRNRKTKIRSYSDPSKYRQI
ncbi:hypothetical protein AAMO2058_000410200 [Amorphochlora amoebiformis]